MLNIYGSTFSLIWAQTFLSLTANTNRCLAFYVFIKCTSTSVITVFQQSKECKLSGVIASVKLGWFEGKISLSVVCGKALYWRLNVTAQQWFICQCFSPWSALLESVSLLCEQLQELCVACCLCQLQRCDSLFVWKTDSHQTPGLAKQQLRQPTQTPSHGQVEGRLFGTVLWIC